MFHVAVVFTYSIKKYSRDPRTLIDVTLSPDFFTKPQGNVHSLRRIENPICNPSFPYLESRRISPDPST